MIVPIELRFKADKDSKSAFRTDKTIKSHDVNSVEFHISIDGLELTDNHTAKILSIFHSSESQVNVDCEIVEGEIIYKPDTNLISRHEHVTSYVYVYNDNQSLDVREFIYTVDLSKIDETSLEVKEVYDQSYADLLADFEQALNDYKDNLPQADSVRADVDAILNQFSVDSQAKLSLINEAEGLRVQAEGQRESSESSRVQAETQRASEESSRVSAESERVLAENERENAEAQRKTDHANRSAELDGKADKVILKNLVINGDFSQGVTGWVERGSTVLSVVENKLRSSLASGVGANFAVGQNLVFNANEKYYIKVGHYKQTDLGSYPPALSIRTSNVASSLLLYVLNYENTTNPQSLSAIVTPDQSGGSMVFFSYLSTVGDFQEIGEVSVFNLTETFGAGNEPTKEEMDRLIEITGYIDGEYALNNKEMLGYLMKGIGEKANKKQEDWITPTLINGWATYPDSPFQYRKDSLGMVHFRGRLNPTNKTDIQFCRLPDSYRPSSITYLNRGNDFYIAVTSTGVCQNYFTNWVSLDGFSFEAVEV